MLTGEVVGGTIAPIFYNFSKKYILSANIETGRASENVPPASQNEARRAPAGKIQVQKSISTCIKKSGYIARRCTQFGNHHQHSRPSLNLVFAQQHLPH